jgi:hypothetical protein
MVDDTDHKCATTHRTIVAMTGRDMTRVKANIHEIDVPGFFDPKRMADEFGANVERTLIAETRQKCIDEFRAERPWLRESALVKRLWARKPWGLHASMLPLFVSKLRARSSETILDDDDLARSIERAPVLPTREQAAQGLDRVRLMIVEFDRNPGFFDTIAIQKTVEKLRGNTTEDSNQLTKAASRVRARVVRPYLRDKPWLDKSDVSQGVFIHASLLDVYTQECFADGSAYVHEEDRERVASRAPRLPASGERLAHIVRLTRFEEGWFHLSDLLIPKFKPRLDVSKRHQSLRDMVRSCLTRKFHLSRVYKQRNGIVTLHVSALDAALQALYGDKHHIHISVDEASKLGVGSDASLDAAAARPCDRPRSVDAVADEASIGNDAPIAAVASQPCDDGQYSVESVHDDDSRIDDESCVDEAGPSSKPVAGGLERSYSTDVDETDLGLEGPGPHDDDGINIAGLSTASTSSETVAGTTGVQAQLTYQQILDRIARVPTGMPNAGYASVIDFIAIVTGNTRKHSATLWHRLLRRENVSEMTTRCGHLDADLSAWRDLPHHSFRTKPSPAAPFKELAKIVQYVQTSRAAPIRAEIAETFCRKMAGDQNLHVEIDAAHASLDAATRRDLVREIPAAAPIRDEGPVPLGEMADDAPDDAHEDDVADDAAVARTRTPYDVGGMLASPRQIVDALDLSALTHPRCRRRTRVRITQQRGVAQARCIPVHQGTTDHRSLHNPVRKTGCVFLRRERHAQSL